MSTTTRKNNRGWQVLIFVGGCLFAYYLMTKPHAGDATVVSRSEAATYTAPVEQPEPIIVSAPPIDVSASTIMNAYEENEVSADDKYKGKHVNVTGRIKLIAKDFTGDAYVELSTGDEYSFNSVRCYFKNNYTAAGLRKGEKITATGLVTGMMMRDVIIRNCDLK